MIRIEPALHGYFLSRRKKHGAGRPSRLQSFKMALCYFALVNQDYRSLARFAMWLAIHGTPKLKARHP